tara:strand:- start:40 stop:567 length:528 start_codon:yes stop_codon:yes gene_type:complete
MTTEITYINYGDVIKATNENKSTRSPKKFYKWDEFKDTLKKIFKFKDEDILEFMINNWDSAINDEIELTEGCVSEIEQLQIKQLSLREVTKIANIGQYAITRLKMKPELALAFSLGIFYATYIFEGTAMYLTVRQIYDIIPVWKRSKNGYKVFQKRFFMDGTNNDITKILYDKEL